ncbi:MAG: glycosyltransferase family 4 protein [Patescibacteria group bacterium]
MKIILLVARDGFSFINQAEALSKGLRIVNIDHKIIRIVDEFPEKEIREYNPDCILGIGSWHSYKDFVEKPRFLGIRAVPWIVSDDAFDTFVNEYNELDLILTTSEYCKSVFVQGGIKKDIVKVVPEAVNDGFWKPILDEDLLPFIKRISITHSEIVLPQTFDLEKIKEKGIPILFTTGGDATSKGALEVIAALGRLDRSVPWIYILKTWPSEFSFGRSILELALAEKLGIRDRLKYIVGEFSDEFMLGLMNLCDIYVAPSRSEGFGLPLVEAQMCGKPVITIAATAAQETIKDGKTGFLVGQDSESKSPRADVKALSEILAKLLSNPRLCEKLGSQGVAYSREHFSPEVIVNQLLKELTNQKYGH